MNHYYVGDKSQAVCWYCEALVETTFAIRDVRFSDASGIEHAVLAAVCDICGNVVATASDAVNTESG